MSLFVTDSDYDLTKSKSTYPVSLAEAKRHLRVDVDFRDDDDYIDSLIQAATTLAENYINKDIAKTTNTLLIYDFDSDEVTIYEGNYISLIDVVNSADASVGTLDKITDHYNSFTIEWTANITSDPIKITFYTGYDESTVPVIIKQAILTKIADLYDNARSNFAWSGIQDTKVFETILNYYIMNRF